MRASGKSISPFSFWSPQQRGSQDENLVRARALLERGGATGGLRCEDDGGWLQGQPQPQPHTYNISLVETQIKRQGRTCDIHSPLFCSLGGFTAAAEWQAAEFCETWGQRGRGAGGMHACWAFTVLCRVVHRTVSGATVAGVGPWTGVGASVPAPQQVGAHYSALQLGTLG